VKSFALASPIAILLVGCQSISDRPIQKVNDHLANHGAYAVSPVRSESDMDQMQERVQALITTNLTVDSAIQIALLNNRELHATLEELGIAEADLIQAGLPRNIELAGSWRFPNEPTPYNNVEYGASANVLDLFMLPFRKKVAARNLEAVEIRVAGEVLGLIADVRMAFFRVQAGQQLLARLESLVELNEVALDLAKRQKEAGNITGLQLSTHQSIYAQARVTAAQAAADLRQRRETLNRLLGLWGEMTTWEIAESLPPIPAEERPVDGLESIAMTNRFDLASARRAMENAEYALSLRTKTRFLPTALHVGGSTEREPHGERLTGPEIELELPIFDQGQGEIARLGARYRQAQRWFEALAINARSEVREARDLLIATRDLAQFYDQVLLPQQREIVRQTLLQYNAMQVGTFDLINAKERELESERRYIDAWLSYWIARSELDRAMLGGSRSSLSTPSRSAISSTPAANDNH
jgi:outer membrane protein, heavy metal efflux system